MSQRVSHFHDKDHYWNGSEGEWTVCGQRMPEVGQDTQALPVCPKCMELWVPVHERRGSR